MIVTIEALVEEVRIIWDKNDRIFKLTSLFEWLAQGQRGLHFRGEELYGHYTTESGELTLDSLVDLVVDQVYAFDEIFYFLLGLLDDDDMNDTRTNTKKKMMDTSQINSNIISNF